MAFTRTRQIEWSECDPAGIVYYPRYSEMFDANTNALFRHATGLSKHETQARYDVVGWPMVESTARFRCPATYGDEVQVTSYIESFGGSSMVIVHRIAHVDGRPICEGRDTRVWVGRHPDRPGGIKAMPLPDSFTSAFFA
ncbi:MAG: acyl-CoA thioesterase [Qingshengfaniella sp.]